ncbi:MAG: ABC-2 transporter permease [Bacillota bacterium]|nr:ABC-2 transporter permease [Bacillota bacterium]
MNKVKVLAIAAKELRFGVFLYLSFFILTLVLTLYFSERYSFEFVSDKSMIDTNYAFMIGLFIHMVVFGTFMGSEKKEEKSNGYALLKQLPVNISEIIFGKYLAVFSAAILALLYTTIINRLFYSSYEISGFVQSYLFLTCSISLFVVGLLYMPATRKTYSSFVLPVIPLYMLILMLPNVLALLLLIMGQEEQYDKLITAIAKMRFPTHLPVSVVFFWFCAWLASHSYKNKEVLTK